MQLNLMESPHELVESPDYYRQQLITYIGNKRQLLHPISKALKTVQAETRKEKLHLFDGFVGSGIVSRLFKAYAKRVVSNDLKPYARVAGNCFLTNRLEVDLNVVNNLLARANREVDQLTPLHTGFIERMYAPDNDSDIRFGERAFYTRKNAQRLDWFRQYIGQQHQNIHDLLLGPLLSAASIHANTAGVFKGFYKDKHTGIGKFGGSSADALTRIKGQIRLQAPVLSRFETDVEVYQQDTNKLISEISGFDLAYFDPPYNQHPYGSNYFMLNLLVDYTEPDDISTISGIPMRGFLTSIGHMDERKLRYNTFRGSRNLRSRNIHVNEHLFLVRKHL